MILNKCFECTKKIFQAPPRTCQLCYYSLFFPFFHFFIPWLRQIVHSTLTWIFMCVLHLCSQYFTITSSVNWKYTQEWFNWYSDILVVLTTLINVIWKRIGEWFLEILMLKLSHLRVFSTFIRLISRGSRVNLSFFSKGRT